MCVANHAGAQPRLKKANRAFENLEYAKAVTLYEKALKKKHRDTLNLSKLAQAYHLTDNYEKEEKIYEELMKSPGIPNEYYFRYGEALKNNSRYAEAKEQFEKYRKLVPADPKGSQMIESCEGIISGSDSLISVEVVNVSALNSKFSEFSPFPYRKGLIITSDRKKNFVDVDKYEWTARPFLAIYYYPLVSIADSVFSKSIALDNPINDDFHNGPACFYNDTTLYFNKVSRLKPKKGQVEVTNRTKIFYTYYDPDVKRKWWEKNATVLHPFQYNSDDYSAGHPCFTPDGNYLFFSSDMPGGFGGKDIYMCAKRDSGWSKPQNLGSEVNTAGDELFPFAKSDKFIYFSSNGHPGHGGMDIFSATRLNENYWTLVKNMKSPINSATDDFGIYFTGNNNGYFSSNRNGGKGYDDIYFFDIVRRNISGRLVNPRDSSPMANRLIVLLDASGKQVDSTLTNAKGFFSFKNLKSDEVYATKIEENDMGLAGYIDNTFNQEPLGIRVYITNQQRKIIDSLQLRSMEYFTYWHLKALSFEAAVASLIDIGMKNQNFIDFQGMIGIQSGADTLPLAGVSMLLNGENGDMRKISITDKEGKFHFDSIPNDQYYLLSIEQKDVPQGSDKNYIVTGKIFHSGTKGEALTNARFYFAGKDNRKLRAVFTDRGGYFNFEFIPKDFYGVGTIFADVDDPLFLLLEEPEDTVGVSLKKTIAADSSVIDFYGNIYYNGDTTQPAANLSVLLKDETGSTVRKVATDTMGKFIFYALPNDQTYSVMMDEDNPSFNPNIRYLILGNIDYQGQQMPAEKLKFYLGSKYDPKLFAMLTDKNGRFKLNYLPSEHYAVVKKKEEDMKMEMTEVSEEQRQFSSFTILFEYDKSDVLKGYEQDMLSTINNMKSDTSLRIAISAHTDSKGDDNYNLQLSKRRANYTMEQFVRKGIKRKRIMIQAFGETQPAAPNTLPDGSDNPEGRRLNRRAEIQIVTGNEDVKEVKKTFE